MKTFGKLWNKICSEDNIKLALKRALTQTNSLKIKQNIYENFDLYLKNIKQQLLTRTYKLGPMITKIIKEKKTREIHYPKNYYPDCIIYYCLMNVIEPYLLTKFTSDTYSSIKNRGVLKALHKLQKIVKFNYNNYFLYIDCKKYFASINHLKLKKIVRCIFKDKYVLDLLDKIIDNYLPGLPIGVYPAQYLANIFLFQFDHYIKENLKLKYYFRYMDDIIIILSTKRECHTICKEIKNYLNSLKLTIKNNVRIANINYGISFLGYVVYPSHTRISKNIKINMIRKDKYLRKNNIDDFIYKLQMSSYFGWCLHANCINLMHKVFADKFYLFKNDIKKYNMKINHIKQSTPKDFYWELPQDKKKSITLIYNLNIVIFDYKIFEAFDKSKIAVKFSFYDPNKQDDSEYLFEDLFYFVTGSIVIIDRILKNSKNLPFICKLERVLKNNKTYTSLNFV